MLDELWKHLTITPELRFLDPACGRGTFLRELRKRLLTNETLIKAFPELTVRDEHIRSKMLYGFEIDLAMVNLLQRQGYVNVQLQDALAYIGDTMKFDVVIGNPPYQKQGSRAEKTTGMGSGSLWHLFVKLAFENLVASKGYVSLIHPNSWRRPGDRLGVKSLILRNNCIYLSMNSLEEGIDTFNAGTTFDWYVVRKEPSNHETTIKDFDGNSYSVNLAKYDFIPNAYTEEIDKLFSEGEKFDVLFDASSFFSQQGVKEYLPGYVRSFYSMKGDSVQSLFFPPSAAAYTHLVPKVIIQTTGHKFHCYDDYKAEYVCGQFCCAILTNETKLVSNQLKKIAPLLDRYLTWGMTRDHKIFALLNKGYFNCK